MTLPIHSVRACALLALAALAACGQDAPPPVLETIAEAPVTLSVEGEGELKSSRATRLAVPGVNWSQRQLAWMLPDGSPVKKGEVVARFSAEQGKQELTQALLDLQRNALARAAKEGELQAGQQRVDVDLAKVATDLAIAQRYATADVSTLARNTVLDAVQDTRLLGVKQDTLEWKRNQSGKRGGAELAVLDAQRASLAGNAKTRQTDMDALELRAPHDGVFVLGMDWSGDKPTIGASLFAGFDLGSLPDTSAMEVELAIPQMEAQGIQVGDAVELHPAGLPAQKVASTISWVASAAKVMGRESPVKFLTMKAPVPVDAVRRYGLVPGQRMEAKVILLRADKAVSVPNIALLSDDGKNYVQVRRGDGFERRAVKLGARGNARSQVVAGLRAGEQVLLVSDADKKSPTGDDGADATRAGKTGVADGRATDDEGGDA